MGDIIITTNLFGTHNLEAHSKAPVNVKSLCLVEGLKIYVFRWSLKNPSLNSRGGTPLLELLASNIKFQNVQGWKGLSKVLIKFLHINLRPESNTWLLGRGECQRFSLFNRRSTWKSECVIVGAACCRLHLLPERRTRHWKNVNIQDLCFDIESQMEKVNLEDGELDSCVNLFESTVRNILDDHAPLKTRTVKPTIWISLVQWRYSYCKENPPSTWAKMAWQWETWSTSARVS